MTQLLVDTDILIDVSNDDESAKQRLLDESRTAEFAVSAVTVMELTVGCRNKTELTALNQFLIQFQVIQIDTSISAQAIRLIQTYVLSHGLRIADALIAATAIETQMPLLSKNQRDFRFISELDLPPYP
ncbi:putative nucleic acid-binding protein [Leptolyngbya sp. PCC 7375]|nr:putative nucleic acid-binding protein [Leptolyngbya sp. PCC 7375]